MQIECRQFAQGEECAPAPSLSIPPKMLLNVTNLTKKYKFMLIKTTNVHFSFKKCMRG